MKYKDMSLYEKVLEMIGDKIDFDIVNKLYEEYNIATGDIAPEIAYEVAQAEKALAEAITKHIRSRIPVNTSIKEAYAVYTGGGIWLYHGKTKEGNYFLTDDDGCTRILNADPSLDFDDALYEEWQQEHLIAELDDTRKTFAIRLMSYLLDADDEHRGGISDREIVALLEYMLSDS